MKLQKIIFLLFAVLTANCSFAQGVSFTVDAPRQVIEGNRFSVSYILSNAEADGGIKESQIEGATKIFGPAISTSSSMQIINGKMSSNSSQEFSYTYRAEKAGKYTVKGATINVNGKTYTSQGFTLEILPPDKSASSARQQQSNAVNIDNIDSQAAGKPLKYDDLFVKIILSKSQAYEQEAILCTIKLYTKYQIQQFLPTLQPSFNGFLIEEVPITAALNEIEHYNGENYMVAILKKCIIYPQQSGKLTITSGNYDVTVIQYEQYRSMFGMMRQPVEKQVKVKSNNASINIVPLPEPKPANFSGAVGDFKISSELKSKTFKTNEASTLVYTINGVGNIKYLKAPTIEFPSQFEVYDPQTNVDAKTTGNNTAGTMTIDYTFIPEYIGEFKIPGASFSYFNPQTKKYVTLTTPSYDLNVTKGVGGSASVSADKKEILQKNKDILHIKKSSDYALSKSQSFIVSGVGYTLWYIIPLMIAIAILIYYRKTLKLRANEQLLKNKKAKKIATKRLKLAKEFMAQNKSNQFYDEMLKATWGYLSDKLGIPVSMLNKENITLELSNYGVAQNVIEDIHSILDACEFAQYAPEQSNSEMSIIYSKAIEIIDSLENTKKKMH